MEYIDGQLDINNKERTVLDPIMTKSLVSDYLEIIFIIQVIEYRTSWARNGETNVDLEYSWLWIIEMK